MKIAMLIQCHKNPQQINMLLKELTHPDIIFFVHVDKKSDIGSLLKTGDNVVILKDEERVDVQWGNWSQVQATLQLIRAAIKMGGDSIIIGCAVAKIFRSNPLTIFFPALKSTTDTHSLM